MGTTSDEFQAHLVTGPAIRKNCFASLNTGVHRSGPLECDVLCTIDEIDYGVRANTTQLTG